MSNRPDEKQPAPPGQSKEMTVSVNGRDKTFTGKKITFREVVSLAYDNPVFTDQIAYTVTFSKGEHDRPKGFLEDGDEVPVKDGMIFNVSRTNKS